MSNDPWHQQHAANLVLRMLHAEVVRLKQMLPDTEACKNNLATIERATPITGMTYTMLCNYVNLLARTAFQHRMSVPLPFIQMPTSLAVLEEERINELTDKRIEELGEQFGLGVPGDHKFIWFDANPTDLIRACIAEAQGEKNE